MMILYKITTILLLYLTTQKLFGVIKFGAVFRMTILFSDN